MPVTVVVLIRTAALQVRTDAVRKCSSSDADFIPLTEKRLDNFRRALRFETVSRDSHDCNREQLAQLGQFIVQAYPAVHSSPLDTDSGGRVGSSSRILTDFRGIKICDQLDF